MASASVRLTSEPPGNSLLSSHTTITVVTPANRKIRRRKAQLEFLWGPVGEPVDEDGVWPAAFVCEALEAVLPSETLTKAVVSERRRMQGAHWGDENGMASRQEGERYREWSERLGESCPFVAAQILKPSAEPLTGQADAEGARVISQRRVYR